MISIFRDKSIAAVFLLIVLLLGTHLHLFVTHLELSYNLNSGLLSMFLDKYIRLLPQQVLIAIYLSLVFVQSIRISMVLNDAKMLGKPGFTTALAYIVLSGLFTQYFNINVALISNSLVIWIYLSCCKLYNNPSPKSLLFNIGFLTAIATILYHPMAIMAAVVVFAVLIVRPFRIAEIIILLMGIMVPYYMITSILFISNHWDFAHALLPSLQFNLPIKKAAIQFWVGISATSILLGLGLYYWYPNSNRMVIQVRKNWGVMVILLLLMLPVSCVFKDAGFTTTILCWMPLAAFIGNYFLYAKRTILPNLLLIVILLIILYNNLSLLK